MGRTSDVQAKFCIPFLRTRITKWSAFQAFCAVQFAWSAQFKSLRKIIPKYLQQLASGIFGRQDSNPVDF